MEADVVSSNHITLDRANLRRGMYKVSTEIRTVRKTSKRGAGGGGETAAAMNANRQFVPAPSTRAREAIKEGPPSRHPVDAVNTLRLAATVELSFLIHGDDATTVPPLAIIARRHIQLRTPLDVTISVRRCYGTTGDYHIFRSRPCCDTIENRTEVGAGSTTAFTAKTTLHYTRMTYFVAR